MTRVHNRTFVPIDDDRISVLRDLIVQAERLKQETTDLIRAINQQVIDSWREIRTPERRGKNHRSIDK